MTVLQIDAAMSRLLENMTDRVAVFTGNAKVLLANKAMHEMHGLPPGSLVGRDVRDLLPDNGRSIWNVFRKWQYEGEPFVFEVAERTLSGHGIYSAVRVVPFPMGDDVWLGIAADLTRQHELAIETEWHECLRVFLLEVLSQPLGAPEPTLRASVTAGLEQLRQFVKAGRCTLFEAIEYPDVRVIACCAIPGIQVVPAGTRIPGLWHYAEKVCSSPEPFHSYADELPEDATTEREFMERDGIVSHLGIPLYVGGTVQGILGLAAFDGRREWPPQTTRWLRLAGEVMLSTVMRARAERDLQHSEEHLSLLVEQAPLPIVSGDTNGKVHYFNPLMRELFGFTPQDVPDIDAWFRRVVVGPEDPADLQRQWREDLGRIVAEGGGTDRREIQLQAADGTVRTVDMSVSIFGNRVVGFITDLTERTRMEAALRQEAALREAIFRNAADGMWAAVVEDDPLRPRFTLWNARMREITGYTSEELEARGVVETIYPDRIAEMSERVTRFAECGEASEELDEITRRDGSKRQVRLSMSSFKDAEGRVNVVAVVHDETERLRLERQQRELEKRLLQAQKLESLGVMAGGVAHDFNNLLLGILGNIDLALNDLSDGSDVRPYLEAAESTARRAAELCNQLLAYSGKGRFVVRAVDLRNLVRDVGTMLERTLSQRAEIAYRLPPKLSAVRGDPAQIRQIVMNLLTNASDALGDDEGLITVTLREQECDAQTLRRTFLDEELPPGRYVALEVTDTGCGMDEQTRQRIFEPFYTTKFAGRGLGMAATLGIVRGHKGAVKIDSQSGRGTRVSVYLPATNEQATPRPTAKPEARSQLTGTVLLADDDPSVRLVGQRMLERMGLKVSLAADGQEAIDCFRDNGPAIDAAILDLTMPAVDGEAACRVLREMNPQLPVVISSGFSEEQEVVQRLLSEGEAATFIQKPYQLQALRAAMQSVMARERPGGADGG